MKPIPAQLRVCMDVAHDVLFKSLPLGMSTAAGTPGGVLGRIFVVAAPSDPVVPVHAALFRSTLLPRHI